MAIAGGVDKVFEIRPVFRAEPSFTSRRATEFTGVDVKIAWIDSVEDVMAFEERMLHRVLTEVAAKHGEAIREHFGTSVTVPDLPFPHITSVRPFYYLRPADDPEVTESFDLLWKGIEITTGAQRDTATKG